MHHHHKMDGFYLAKGHFFYDSIITSDDKQSNSPLPSPLPWDAVAMTIVVSDEYCGKKQQVVVGGCPVDADAAAVVCCP